MATVDISSERDSIVLVYTKKDSGDLISKEEHKLWNFRLRVI